MPGFEFLLSMDGQIATHWYQERRKGSEFGQWPSGFFGALLVADGLGKWAAQSDADWALG